VLVALRLAVRYRSPVVVVLWRQVVLSRLHRLRAVLLAPAGTCLCSLVCHRADQAVRYLFRVARLLPATVVRCKSALVRVAVVLVAVCPSVLVLPRMLPASADLWFLQAVVVAWLVAM